MSKPKPDFATVIKTSIPSITKHPQYTSPNSKCSTNDTIQVGKNMTKDSRDNSNCEQSSQQNSFIFGWTNFPLINSS